ncbi:DUF2953 domain-containing protein [Blautia sp. OF03-15BH]|uniref:DUF2953 domain-containing protein n=1 Tax=Blautia sp. OF03-15BH TaxID=2292287 RepID=UPI000E4928B4|nr:DUF2953 domain-containing protein [Blautia sp. OF03-15BH]RGY01570.1 DUF2953 domain-containing protein [Blautia sp. OF03-15BH]
MLHIILLILKAVGILLAAVLLLLLLCILLLLFVPLRYEIAFRHTETETAVQGKVSWLLHLIRAKLFYEKSEGKRLLVKIGSFQLIPKKEKKKKKQKPVEKAKLAPKPVEKSVQKPVQPVEQPEKAVEKPEKVQKQEEQVRRESLQKKPVQPVLETETKEKPQEESIPEVQSHPGPEQIPKKSRLSALAEKLRGIPNFFRKLWAVFLAVGQQLKRQAEKLRRLFHSLSELKAKLSHYIEIWQEEETQTLIRSLKGYLFYLLHHIRPRRGRGYLKYGFPDPALTGQLTGLFYVLRPLAFSELALEPVFETDEILLEGDLVIRGHIRLVHLVRVGLKLLFDKNLKHFRQRLKE